MDRQRDPRGALVRPYAVTRGRTEPLQDIALEAVLVASPTQIAESRFAGHDKHRIATVCEAGPSRWRRSPRTPGYRWVSPGCWSPTWWPRAC